MANFQSVLKFDGQDDSVRIGAINLASASFTVEFWARRAEANKSHYILSQGESQPNKGLHIGFRDNNLFTIAFYGNDLNSSSTYTDNLWHHWCCTYNQTNKEQIIYCDGRQVARRTVKDDYQGKGDLFLGTYLVNYGWFKGQLAEVRLWNISRSPEEIQQNLYRRLVGNEAGLVGYWPLNEGSGTTTSDKTNGGNHGTITSATWEEQIFLQPANQERPFQSVLAFDGQDDCVEIKAHVNPINALTVSLWAKSNASTWNQYGCLASKRDAYILHPQAGSKELYFYVFIAGAWQSVKYTPSVEITQWHHYAGTFDGKTLRLYFDATEVASLPISGTINADQGPLYIGLDDGFGRYFNGQVTEVRVWNRPLSKEEVQKEMEGRLVGNELGLVGYWPLNEGAGNTVADKSTFANHAQIKGGAIWHQQIFLAVAQPSTLLPTDTTIRFKPALAFDGKTACINLGKKPAFKIEQTITLEAWVFAEKLETLNGIISSIFDIGSTESGYGLVIDGKGGVYLGIKPTSGGLQYAPSSPGALKLNEWHHLAGTYDGQRMKVYVDGVEKGTQTLKALRINYEPENDLLIGMYKDNNQTRPFQGKILEVRLWNRVRSPEELQKDMNRYLQGNEPGLVGYWRLNEGSGTTVSDKTSQGNQGIINGAIWQQ